MPSPVRVLGARYPQNFEILHANLYIFVLQLLGNGFPSDLWVPGCTPVGVSECRNTFTLH